MTTSRVVTLASLWACCVSLSCRGHGCQDEPPPEEPPCEPLCNGCGGSDGCGGTCGCPEGEECIGVECVEICPYGRCAFTCSPCRDGFCPGIETDDREHCGWPDSCEDCGRGAVCAQGACKACAPGEIVCGNDCVPEDNAHCGPDCTMCPEGSRCVDGDCRCNDPRQTFCGTCLVADTAEHCGGCEPCRVAGEVCVAGTCQCPVGQIPCGGACVTPNTNEHCGDCETTCPADTVCKPRSSTPCDCKKRFFDYCEDVGRCVDTRTDPMHCGDCNTECPADQICRRGRCVANDGGCDTPCSTTKPCCWKTNTCERKADCDRLPDP